MGVSNGFGNGLLAAHINYFGTLCGFVPAVVVPVLAFATVFKLNLVPIQHIGINIGYTPAYFLVKANNYIRCARQRYPVYVNAGCAQLYLVPYGWKGKM